MKFITLHSLACIHLFAYIKLHLLIAFINLHSSHYIYPITFILLRLLHCISRIAYTALDLFNFIHRIAIIILDSLQCIYRIFINCNTLITLHLLHCLYHIACTALHLSHCIHCIKFINCIYRVAFIALELSHCNINICPMVSTILTHEALPVAPPHLVYQGVLLQLLVDDKDEQVLQYCIAIIQYWGASIVFVLLPFG